MKNLCGKQCTGWSRAALSGKITYPIDFKASFSWGLIAWQVLD